MSFTIRQSVLFMIATFGLWANCHEGYASCGDWLAKPDETMQEHTSYSQQNENAAASSSESRSVPQEQPRPSCSGPECRQTPAAPLQPLPKVVNVSSNDALLSKVFGEWDASAKTGPGWKLFNESILIGYGSILERPPQFAV